MTGIGAVSMDWAAIAKKLGKLFGLPRAYAVGSKGGWSRIHEPLDVVLLEDLLRRDVPVAVALRSPDETSIYSKDHHWAVFDVDSTSPQQSIEVTSDIHMALFGMDFVPLLTHSGKKGFHLFVFFDKPYGPASVSKWQENILNGLGATRMAADKYRFGNVFVDTLVTRTEGKGKIVKLPFSKHQSVDAREVPWKDINFPPDEHSDMAFVFLDSEFKRSSIPEISETEKKLEQLEVIKGDWNFDEPISAAVQSQMLRKVDRTPCLKAAFDDAVMNKGVFWSRVAIATALARAGYSAAQVAYFFRDNINDEEDNRDPSKMKYYVSYCFDRKEWASCKIFQNPDGHSPICPHPCGRPSPDLDVYVSDERSIGSPVLCPDCGTRLKRIERYEPWSAVASKIIYKCFKCGVNKSEHVINYPERREHSRFKDVFMESPTEKVCTRRMDSYSQYGRAMKATPTWRRTEMVKCIKCEAWQDGYCDTNDDRVATDIYSPVEIDIWRRTHEGR